MKKYDILPLLYIFIISVFSSLALFLIPGRPATFDSPIHITFIAQYTQALFDGNFPVVWLGGFANYGLPLGLFSHQFPLTIAAVVNKFLYNPLLTFEIFVLFGIFLSNIVFYKFLRIYFSLFSSLAGITLLTFSSYRITDIYIRGDMPEIFSGIFLGLILLGVYNLIQKKNIWGIIIIVLSYFALSLTHPMMLVTYSFLVIPYIIFLLFSNKETSWKLWGTSRVFTKENIKITAMLIFAILLGLSMASYFLIPLITETKYLYYGLYKTHLEALFLSWNNFFNWEWFYFYQNDIFTRGQFISPGILEIILFTIGIAGLVWEIIRKRLRAIISIRDIAVIVAFIVLFLTTSLSLPLYLHIPILSNIQFPWRMLSVFVFLPPIILASFLDKINKIYITFLIIFIICILRFPQVYGKNYTDYPLSTYYFTTYNLSSVDMNTIWSGKTETYPVEKNKIDIISGEGKIISEDIHNAKRNYVIDAKSNLRLVDYTFYFPGWNVYVDGVKTPIEFQDPSYRGVITYTIPQGRHNISIVFEDTQIRRLGKILSIIFIALFGLLVFLRKKLGELIFK